MQQEQALTALGHLVGLTTGWTDAAIEQYAHEFERLENGEALLKACETVARSWGEARKPPLTVILASYRSEVARSAMIAELPANVMPPSEGVKVVQSAYESECRLDGREPNLEYLKRVTSGLQ